MPMPPGSSHPVLKRAHEELQAGHALTAILYLLEWAEEQERDALRITEALDGRPSSITGRKGDI